MKVSRLQFITLLCFALLVVTYFVFFKKSSLENSQSKSLNLEESLESQVETLKPEKNEPSVPVDESQNTGGPKKDLRLGSRNLEIIKACVKPLGLKSLDLLKKDDQINGVFDILNDQRPSSHIIDVENLHFVDQQGEELRFQILSENESRFFKVDAEGLPIRIEAPEGFKNLSPLEQKQRLIQDFKNPKFSQTMERYTFKDKSFQLTKRGSEIEDLQVFIKSQDNKVLGSFGCAVFEGSVTCKCL